VCEQLLQSLDTGSGNVESISFPAESDNAVVCPIGLTFVTPVAFDSWSLFHVKTDADGKVPQFSGTPLVHTVYFPLMAIVIPKWLGILAGKNRFSTVYCAKTLFLISGSGLVRHDDTTAICYFIFLNTNFLSNPASKS
jgi:hypothetical protein